MSFSALGLAPELLRAVPAQGYTDPTPVQREAIPLVLAGRDLLAGAQTGTGKTAAFVLPMLQLLAADAARGTAARPRDPRADPGPHPRAGDPGRGERPRLRREQLRRSTTIYGGVGFPGQLSALRSGPEIVVATPGRLLDHSRQRTIDLGARRDPRPRRGRSDARHGLHPRHPLDHRPAARRAAEPPLQRDVLERDPRRWPRGCWTGPHRCRSRRATRRPTSSARSSTRSIAPASASSSRTWCAPTPSTRRSSSRAPSTAPIGSPSSCWRTASPPRRSTATSHSPSACARSTTSRPGRVTLLIATEVAARGLDIEQLPHVVNYELPMVPSDYLHRIGRTGRAGIEGDAISLVCVDEAPMLRDIERLLGRPDPVRGGCRLRARSDRIAPEPIRLRSGQGGGGRPPRHHAPTSHAGAPRRGRPQQRRGDRRPVAGSSLGNRSGGGGGRWVPLPGERNRR